MRAAEDGHGRAPTLAHQRGQRLGLFRLQALDLLGQVYRRQRCRQLLDRLRLVGPGQVKVQPFGDDAQDDEIVIQQCLFKRSHSFASQTITSTAAGTLVMVIACTLSRG